MMKTVITRLLKCLDRKTLEREVAEELSFHIELLEQKHRQQGMSSAQAKTASLKRFGDVNKIKNQCLEISRRRRPVRRVLKTASILLAITGFVVHIVSSDFHVTRIGTMLIVIAISGRLLLFARSWNPSSFLPTNRKSSLTLFTD